MFNPLAQVAIKDSSGKEVIRCGYLTELPLLDLNWSLEIDENASSCSFSIPLIKEILDKLLLIKPYEPPTQTNSDVLNSNGGLGSATNTIGKENHIRVILEEARKQGITNKKQLAYILATVDHETNWNNFTELASGGAYEGRSDLGNTQPGDGVRFKGRGYVQLTGRANYKKYSALTGKDLVSNPELAASNPVMVFVLIHGMKTGSFTGVSLSDFTSASGNVDYYNARAIINGDKETNGSSIAAKAKQYENHPLLQNLTPASTDKVVEVAATNQTSNTPAHKIHIYLGELNALFVEYIYLLSDIQVQVGDQRTIQISGITPLWSINQYKRTETLSNVTLKQLAERVARNGKLSLEFSGKGSEIVFLENNGLTDYQVLLREAKRAGYVISHSGTKLVVQPIRKGKLYEINTEEIISFTSSIKPSSPLAQSTGGIRGTWNAKPNQKTEVKSGTIQSKNTSPNRPNNPKNKTESKTTGLVTDSTGKTITEDQAQSELARVQDNPSSIKFIPQASDLLISPTDMVRIKGLEKYSDRLAKIDYWVSSVSGSYSDSGLLLELGLYQPGRSVQLNQSLAGNSDKPATLSEALPGDTTGFIIPMKNGRYTYAREPKFGQRGGNHGGVDIFGDTLDVFASASGVVRVAADGCSEGSLDCGRGFGNVVYIDHPGGYTTIYAHLAQGSITVRRGERVSQGQRIGKMGNTGHSFGAHLHWEIKLNGRRINPETKVRIPAPYG